MKFFEIKIRKEKENPKNWVYEVYLQEIREKFSFRVFVDKDYHKEITGLESNDPTVLLKKSFEFLLEKESVESITREFNLKEIKKYFSEYERNMKRFFKRAADNLAATEALKLAEETVPDVAGKEKSGETDDTTSAKQLPS